MNKTATGESAGPNGTPNGARDLLKKTKSNPWTDLGLTLPLFVAYHLGVAFLPVRNAADWMTRQLVLLSDYNMVAYGGLTVGVASVYVGMLVLLGRGRAFRGSSFLSLIVEAVVYAVAMRLLAGYVVGRISLAAAQESPGFFTGIVLSCGAGFYEEIAFRVGLFALGYRLLNVLFPLARWQRPLVWLAWALTSSLVFSLWHYVGPTGDSLDFRSFTFRAVCGLVFTVIYVFRGFAPAVWTHALYDIWVLAV